MNYLFVLEVAAAAAAAAVCVSGGSDSSAAAAAAAAVVYHLLFQHWYLSASKAASDYLCFHCYCSVHFPYVHGIPLLYYLQLVWVHMPLGQDLWLPYFRLFFCAFSEMVYV